MNNNDPIVIEQLYSSPVEKLWNAITEKNEMKKWYFDLPDFEPVVSCHFSFYGGDVKQYLHLSEIIEVVPYKKLSYTWRYDGYEGNSTVSFELFPEGNFTRLKLTHSGLETFPANPDFAKENFVAGWTYITGVSLKDYLGNNK